VRPKAIRKIPSKNYDEVIEVLCPIRFYWVNGDFDGVELGPLPPDLPKSERRLITHLCKSLPLSGGKTYFLSKRRKSHTKVPDVFIKAFAEGNNNQSQTLTSE